jgi:prepilin-type N-terminal cleavage/methylation domain-containing protein
VARTRTTNRPAFSLLELIIVIVIIAIIAAIAVPRLSTGTANTKTQALLSSLQEVRDRIDAYAAEHGGKFPDLRFVEQMTQYTDEPGNVSEKPDPKYPFGPYLAKIPVNPYSNSNSIRFLLSAGQSLGARQQDRGWTYNVATGEFNPDLADARVTDAGTPMNKL